MLCHQQVSCRLGEDQFIARRDQVRLDQIVIMLRPVRISPVTPGRPARAIRSDFVVCARIGPESVSRADSDRGRFVAWRMDLSVNFLSVVILPIVASRSQANYSSIDQAAHSATNGIIPVRVNSRRAQTHVDDTDIVSRAIIYHPTERFEQTRGRASAVLIQDAQIDEVGIGCDAKISGVGDAAIASGSRSDMCAMTVRIIGAILASEITADNHSRIAMTIK